MVARCWGTTIYHISLYNIATLLLISLISIPTQSCTLQDLPFYVEHEESYAEMLTQEPLNPLWLAPEDIIEREVVKGKVFHRYEYQVQRLLARKIKKNRNQRKHLTLPTNALSIFPDTSALETLSSACWMFNSFNAQSGQSLNIYIQNRLPQLSQRLAKKSIVLVLVSPDYEDQGLYSYYWLGSRADIDTLIMQIGLQFGRDNTTEWLSITEQPATVTPQLWNSINLALIDNFYSLGLREAVNETLIHEASNHDKQQFASKNKSTAAFVLGIPCHYKD